MNSFINKAEGLTGIGKKKDEKEGKDEAGEEGVIPQDEPKKKKSSKKEEAEIAV